MALPFHPQPKPDRLLIEERKAKKLTRAEREKAARAEARKRYGSRCAVPGCREPGEMHHIQPRSTAPQRRADPTNLRPVCHNHHTLIHRGKLTAWIDQDGEFIVTGPRKYLAFKL